jgi:biotin operon repressor
MPEVQEEEVMNILKALAEPNRLRIVGLLAERPHSVEDLSSRLGVSMSTVSHHLSRLAGADLVRARAEGYYSIYSLQPEVLTAFARNFLHKERQPNPVAASAGSRFEKQVLTTFTSEDGRITAFPVQEKKYLVLLRYVVREFHPGIRYPEKKVNQILSRFNEDTARLRRSLVDYGFMAREGGGGRYWRL